MLSHTLCRWNTSSNECLWDIFFSYWNIHRSNWFIARRTAFWIAFLGGLWKGQSIRWLLCARKQSSNPNNWNRAAILHSILLHRNIFRCRSMAWNFHSIKTFWAIPLMILWHQNWGRMVLITLWLVMENMRRAKLRILLLHHSNITPDKSINQQWDLWYICIDKSSNVCSR